jgi:Major Facilitator Superfamily
VIANDLRLNMRWIDTEVPAEMNAKPLTIEKGTGAKHGCAGTDLPRHIGEGIGRIGDDEENGIRGQAMAIWGMGVVMGPILGPTLGGYLTDFYNWRWVF